VGSGGDLPGEKQKFLTVVTNLETGEPLWFGRERKQETLDEFFEKQLSAVQRSAIRTACVDMWEPFRQSLEQCVPECRIIYDKFHILQHAGQAVDEVRRAEYFRKGGAARNLVWGKRWLLLTSWLPPGSRQARSVEHLVCFEATHSSKPISSTRAFRSYGTMPTKGPRCVTCRVGSTSCAGSG
jgi:transposase